MPIFVIWLALIAAAFCIGYVWGYLKCKEKPFDDDGGFGV